MSIQLCSRTYTSTYKSQTYSPVLAVLYPVGQTIVFCGPGHPLGRPRSSGCAHSTRNSPYPSLTTVEFLKKSGANSNPMPGPAGTGITPFLISKFGEYHDSFFGGFHQP